MKSILPNCRWLAISSENLGRDWYEKSREIDDRLEEWGLDLAEESVFLLFDSTPKDVLSGDGRCQVARSVLGPKKAVNAPFTLVDWVQSPVHSETLRGQSWEELLTECQGLWDGLQLPGAKSSSRFMLLIKRRLKNELTLSIEVLFKE